MFSSNYFFKENLLQLKNKNKKKQKQQQQRGGVGGCAGGEQLFRLQQYATLFAKSPPKE